MVLCSKEISNVLNDIFLSEFARNINTPRYYAIRSTLFNLDKRYVNRIIGRYPAWKRCGMYEIQIGCHIFGYSWDGTTVYLEEYFKERIRENLQNKKIIFNTMKNKKVIRLTESDLHNMIAEAVKTVLDEVNVKCTDGTVRDLHGNDQGSWRQISKIRKEKRNQSPKYSDEWERHNDAMSRAHDHSNDMEMGYLDDIRNKLSKY